MNSNPVLTSGSSSLTGKRSDVRPIGVTVYLLPVTTRMPLKFGPEVVTRVACARVQLTIRGRDGKVAEGWGETPLSVQWTWPGSLSFEERESAMVEFCKRLALAWATADIWGHPLEVGYQFQHEILIPLLNEFNCNQRPDLHMPYLAALVCCSAFDIALHDAYGQLHAVPTYETYDSRWMNHDLSEFFGSNHRTDEQFKGKFPDAYLARHMSQALPVWHLVGGLDPLDDSELTGSEPDDGYPVTLSDWIKHDGLKCLKVKLRGNDSAWDYDRLIRVARIGGSLGVELLSADFNCTVTDPEYVIEILDRLARDSSQTFRMLLYVEQPFPYDLARFPIDVSEIAARKPLFLDESAHDWQHVQRGIELGWTGVALKTCKTQTGAILSLCWARAHGMQIMVQDLTNPMLAQLSHVLLAAHANTIMGVESNAPQFYPEASVYEAKVHPGLYARRNGQLDGSSIFGNGLGYRLDEIGRPLPEPAFSF